MKTMKSHYVVTDGKLVLSDEEKRDMLREAARAHPFFKALTKKKGGKGNYADIWPKRVFTAEGFAIIELFGHEYKVPFVFKGTECELVGKEFKEVVEQYVEVS